MEYLVHNLPPAPAVHYEVAHLRCRKVHSLLSAAGILRARHIDLLVTATEELSRGCGNPFECGIEKMGFLVDVEERSCSRSYIHFCRRMSILVTTSLNSSSGQRGRIRRKELWGRH